MSYRAPISDPRALRRARQPLAQHANLEATGHEGGPTPQRPLYPLSLADSPSTALAQPSTGFDLRTLLLLLAAAAFGLWLYNRLFAKKQKSARNEPMYYTTGGPLRGLDRAAKRIKQHAELMKRDGYDGAAKDLREASDIIEGFTSRTREQAVE